jgi:hypothetical protein
MRTPEQINHIQKTISDPYLVADMISHDDLIHLINIFKNDPNKIKKNTGPITLNLAPHFDDLVVKKIIDRLKIYIGDFEITASFFFETDYPHVIHNDDTFELPDSVYKAITLPLELDNFNGVYPKLCFFDQFYFHGPAKFFQKEIDIPTYYNQCIYDYKNVDRWVKDAYFDDTVRRMYLQHLKPKWLTGLTFWGALDWKPGNAIIFDSTRLHCASDFRPLNITKKIGISIFTKVI